MTISIGPRSDEVILIDKASSTCMSLILELTMKLMWFLIIIQTLTLCVTGEVSFLSTLYQGNEKDDVGLSLVP